MNEDFFEQLEQTLRSQGADAGFELLVGHLREQKKYPLVFEARLMQLRLALGQPLLQRGGAHSGQISGSEHEPAYEAGVMKAARETGNLFLADGEIARAWPYFRAIGDPGPIAEAIERVPPADAPEPVIQIALNEGVNPRKGFEMLLQQQGICSAISFASQYPDAAARLEFLRILVRALSGELMRALKEAIAAVEGGVPEAGRITELIAGRDWLFADSRCYTENSHLLSLVQASPDVGDSETLQLAWDLAEYGRRLDPMHQFPGDPPFTDTYTDYSAYLSALLGQDVDAAVAHFYKKVGDSVPGSAEILVGLLARIGRSREAIDVSVQYLNGDAGRACPSALELCQGAGDYERLRRLAREEGDLLAFAAGILQSP